MRTAAQNITAVLALPVMLAACAPEPPGPVEFAQAEQVMLNGDYDAAAEQFKRFLVWNPDHAGAHYYLARCYYAKETFWLTIARGEVATALELFIEQGRQSPIERYDAEYFEFICHIDIARISRVQAMVVMANDLPPESARGFIDQADAALDRARTILPDSADIGLVEREIAEAETVYRQYTEPRSVESPYPAPYQTPGTRRSPSNRIGRFTSYSGH